MARRAIKVAERHRCIYISVHTRLRCDYVWDEAKNRANKAKHGVSFELAQLVFDDPLHLSVPDRNGHGEERWQAIGLVGSVWLLLVIHTYVEQNGEEIIRLVSARKATRRERALYEEGQGIG